MAGILTTLMQYRRNRAIADQILAEDAKQEAEKARKKKEATGMSPLEFQNALNNSLRRPAEEKKK